MKTITVTRSIGASRDEVFATVADIKNYSRAVPHITHVEFLTEQQVGVGTRFRETRLMKGREHTTELEVTEYIENDRVRMVADAGGTVWDSTFTVREADGATVLQLRMEARAHKLMAKLFNRLIRGMVVKGVEADIDAVKQHCEHGSN